MIFISYWYWMKHVISHIHLVSVYWMKHITFQLSEHSCAVWYCQQIWYDLQFDIIRSLILCVIWYCLHSFILFFLFNSNCASTSLYISRLEHALLILYFFHYQVFWMLFLLYWKICQTGGQEFDGLVFWRSISSSYWEESYICFVRLQNILYRTEGSI